MEKKFILATLAILFFILLGIGSVLSEQCVDISGCRQCWKTTPVVIQSDLCVENSTCIAQPQDQQNNAIVDAVLCGCNIAKASSYQGTDVNHKIEDVIVQYTGFNLTAAQICEHPGTFLIKRNYG